MKDKIIELVVSSSSVLASTAVVIIASLLVYMGLKRGLTLLQRNKKMAVPLVATLLTLLRWIVFLITVLLVLQQFGVLPNVWAAIMAILAAIAIGLVAGWSVLSNLFSTFLILFFRPFRIGDTVEVPAENIRGEVIDLNFMHTSLRDTEDRIARVPNNTFFLKPLICTEGKTKINLYDQLQSEKPYDA